MITLELFSRSECGLCDQAERLINEVLVEYESAYQDFSFKKIDIDSDPVLNEKYSLRIPVVFRKDIQQELNWPFPKSRLRSFLDTL